MSPTERTSTTERDPSGGEGDGRVAVMVASASNWIPRRRSGPPTPKVALVTGAGGGIGAALARVLGARGWVLTLVDIEPERLDAVAGELRASGCRVQALVADLARRAEVDRVVDSALDRWGHVGLCLPFAGIYVDPEEELSPEVTEFVGAVNLDHPLALIDRVLDAADERDDGCTVVVPLSDAGLELRSEWVYARFKAELHARSGERRARVRRRPGQTVLDVVVYPTETEFGRNSDVILEEQVGPDAGRSGDNRSLEEWIRGARTPRRSPWRSSTRSRTDGGPSTWRRAATAAAPG